MQLQATTVWFATQPVDFRAGGDRLSLHEQQALGRPPCDGTAYVFSNRRHTRLKVVCWDGNGVWMCVRRLHRGQFVWPQAGDSTWELSGEQWQWLVCGTTRRVMGQMEHRKVTATSRVRGIIAWRLL